MIIGHIGARKGSKGVLRKNFKSLAGKPLIDWSLDQLINSSKIDIVVVSTDDEDIYDHSIRKGTLDIGLRPFELSDDKTSKWNVWQHSLQETEKKVGEIELFVDLDCTSPLREIEDINNSIELFLEKKPDMVMSCCIARKNPYFNLVELDENGSLKISKKPKVEIHSRQNVPIVYEHAASTYVLDPNYLKNAVSLYEGYVIPYIMPSERCWDIDSEFDFKIVEFLMYEKNIKR